MTDSELLLTENGTDITDQIWDWGSLGHTSAWGERDSLSYVRRQAFGAASAPVPFADVKLWNKLTGSLLFEGIVTASPVIQRHVDPGWVDTTVSVVGIDGLLDTSVLQVPYTMDMSGGGTYPRTRTMLAEVMRLSFADARMPTTVTEYVYAGVSGSEWGMQGLITAKTWAACTPTPSVIADIIAESLSYENDSGGIMSSGYHVRGTDIRWVPGIGFVLASPLTAFLGAAPVTFGSANMPADVTYARDDGTLGSAIAATGDGGANPHLVVTDPTTTNGYTVARPWSAPWTLGAGHFDDAWIAAWYADAGGDSSVMYSVKSARTTADLRVGQSISVYSQAFGTVSGVIQSVSTQFVGGSLDTTATAWPRFLDSGRLVDGTWALDAAVSSSIERHPRIISFTFAAPTSSPSALATPRRYVHHINSRTR